MTAIVSSCVYKQIQFFEGCLVTTRFVTWLTQTNNVPFYFVLTIFKASFKPLASGKQQKNSFIN